jgi:hypothetical protein
VGKDEQRSGEFERDEKIEGKKQLTDDGFSH